MDDRRCPNCGALVSATAEWCGQCFTPLGTEGLVDPGTGPATVTATAERPGIPSAIEVDDGRPTWVCPACEARNPIEAALCATCGTPFSRLLQDPVRSPEIEPQTAAIWSMVYPGLGHWKLGRRADAVARVVMFSWSLGTLLILLVSRFGKGGLGPTFPLVVLFLGAASALYASSAIDAYRLASGDPPLVSSRALLWASAGLVVLSVLIASLVTLPAARR